MKSVGVNSDDFLPVIQDYLINQILQWCPTQFTVHHAFRGIVINI